LVSHDVEELTATYERIASAMSPHVDIFMCETMSCVREALAAARAAASVARDDQSVWVAWTLMEDESSRLRSGETIDEAVEALVQGGLTGRISGVLYNCSLPNSVTAAMPRLVELAPRLAGPLKRVVVGAYANGFQTVKSPGGGAEYDEDLTPEVYCEVCEGWMDSGASAIGGCCGVFPEHIAAVHETVMHKNFDTRSPGNKELRSDNEIKTADLSPVSVAGEALGA
jgi:S-methylmethionine-dependent homocysteine/selenocysteine methylase